MKRYALLATVGYDWSLVGWPVWVVLAIGSAGALATAGRRFPPQPVQVRLRILLPLIMCSLCVLTRSKSWFGFFYKFYYAQLDVAFIVSFAFGVAFTLAALRARDRFTWMSAGCYIPI